MQYWLGGSDDNVEQMVRFLISRYAHDRPKWRREARRRSITPRWGSITPICPGHRITTDPADLPAPENPVATVGLLMMRSYVLASDTAHYDAVIRKLQARGLP
jgi:magnesium chelatase subunit H